MKRIFSLLFLLGTTYFLFAQTNEFELKSLSSLSNINSFISGYHYGKQNLSLIRFIR
jgi:hypothetical protein